jgi:hypothetical protein
MSTPTATRSLLPNADETYADERRHFSLRDSISKNALLLAMALVKFLLHMASSTNYGFFVDELYYIDAGKHLSFGYVDFPSFMGLDAALTHLILGDSLMAYRVFPALAGALIVFLAGLITRELGGGTFAQFLVALAMLISPQILWLGSTLTTGAFDPLWWILAIYILVLLIKRERPRLWLLFGLVVGIGITTKLTIISFGAAVVLGLLLTPQRKYLFNRWFWLGGAIALAFLIPYVLWNAAHDWSTVAFYQVYSKIPTNAFSFFFLQVFMESPILVPLWGIGLYCVFFTEMMRPYRVFGWIFIILYILFTLTQANFYFLAPAYVVPLAAGSMQVERITFRPRWRWVKPAYVALIALVGMGMMPFAIPVLPFQVLLQTSTQSGITQTLPTKGQPANTPQLPYGYQLEMGWESMTATVAHVYQSLPPTEQGKTCILAQRYGEAGALDYYGPQYHLPPVISGHNSYYFWGPGNCTGEVIISLGYPLNLLQSTFSVVKPAGISTCQYCAADFSHIPIYVCYHIKTSMKAAWAKFEFLA